MDSFDISASALSAQRLRLDIIASNLANVNTTRDASGKIAPYHRKNVVFAPILQEKMGGGNSESGAMMFSSGERKVSFENGQPILKMSLSASPMEGAGVEVVDIADDTKTPMKMVYDPSHPDANAEGYVALPNINPVTEMVDMISASRAYEANVSSIQTAKTIGKAALEI